MSHQIIEVRKALVAWLRREAVSAAEVESAHPDFQPLFRAMASASGASVVAYIAREIESCAEMSDLRKVTP